MFEEADGNHSPLRMILHRDYGSLGVKRAVAAFDDDAVGEFQRMVDDKQNFARRAKLDDGVLKENDALVFLGTGVAVAIVIVIAIAGSAAQFDGNPHRRGFGK